MRALFIVNMMLSELRLGLLFCGIFGSCCEKQMPQLNNRELNADTSCAGLVPAHDNFVIKR
tara:strand:- start:163 stop:345 length:183 start_codon:yes stop_codon:yes gene_type:complete